jgi:hypothetical protein
LVGPGLLKNCRPVFLVMRAISLRWGKHRRAASPSGRERGQCGEL